MKDTIMKSSTSWDDADKIRKIKEAIKLAEQMNSDQNDLSGSEIGLACLSEIKRICNDRNACDSVQYMRAV